MLRAKKPVGDVAALPERVFPVLSQVKGIGYKQLENCCRLVISPELGCSENPQLVSSPSPTPFAYETEQSEFAVNQQPSSLNNHERIRCSKSILDEHNEEISSIFSSQTSEIYVPTMLRAVKNNNIINNPMVSQLPLKYSRNCKTQTPQDELEYSGTGSIHLKQLTGHSRISETIQDRIVELSILNSVNSFYDGQQSECSALSVVMKQFTHQDQCQKMNSQIMALQVGWKTEQEFNSRKLLKELFSNDSHENQGGSKIYARTKFVKGRKQSMQCPNFLKPALRNHKISQPNSHIKIQNNNKNPQIPKILQHSIVRRKRKQTQLIQSSELEKTAGNNFQTESSISRSKQCLSPRNHKRSDQGSVGGGLYNLLEALMSQVQLDDDFRMKKQWFQRSTCGHKWEELRLLLLDNRIVIGQESLKKVFSVHEDQFNPFHNNDLSRFTLSALLQSFLNCESHWNDNIIRQFSRSRLQDEGFTENSLDIAQKGAVQIQDLVRFLNIQMDVFLRSRDMFLIWNRLTTTVKTSFQGILDKIAI